MRRSEDTCASCRYFDIEASVKAGGKGSCEWQGQTEWTWACVLYSRCSDREYRKQFVIQLMKAKGK